MSLFRINGEEAESGFCEHKRLNMSTLRMTWEAKVQLKDILVNSGFPEGTCRLRLLCSYLFDCRPVAADLSSLYLVSIRVFDDSDVEHSGT